MRTPILLLVMLLAVPLAQGHVANFPPDIQGLQYQRNPVIEKMGVVGRIDLLLKPDPFSHLLRYQIDPRTGGLSEQYRPSAASLDGAFAVGFNFTRLLEYNDVNKDLIYDSNIDTLVRSWTFKDATWTATEPRAGTIATVPVKSMSWEGRFAGGPRVSLLAATAGLVFSDEGARAAPQDVMLYLDFTEFPPRGTGHLFSLEGTVAVDPTTGVREAIVQNQNLTTGLFVEAPTRLAFLSWGGEAVLDGLETRLQTTLGRRVENADGTATYAFGIHMPIMDKSARFVLVTGMQYKTPERGTPGFEAMLVVVAIVLAARGALNRSSR